MMKNWRKILLGVVGVLIVAALIMCAYFLQRPTVSDTAKKYEAGDITRYEWIEKLCDYTGALDDSSSQPYFDDVSSGNHYYEYIQAAVEWGYIEQQPEFNGDDIASGRFIALTAIKTVGKAKIQMYLNTDRTLTDDDYLDVAVNNGIIEKSEYEIGFSAERANEVINKVDELYFEAFWPRDVEQYEYQEEVIELDSSVILEYDGAAESLMCTASLTDGNIILFEDNGFIVARKVNGVLDDGAYELAMPELQEVFETLVQSGVATVSFQDIVNYYGENNLIVAQNESRQGQPRMVSNIVSGEISSKGFKIEAEGDEETLKIYVTDNGTGIRYLLPISPEISKDYEDFSACLDVNSIFVGSQIAYSSKEGVRSADVAVDIKSSFEGGLSASDEISDRLILFETPTPIGNGLVGVDIQIYLVTTLDGQIYIEAEMPFQSTVHYEKGKGIRHIKHEIDIADPRIEASLELQMKVAISPILIVCKFEPVLDAEIDVGVSTAAEVEIHNNARVCSDVEIAYPIIGISVGDEDILYKGKQTWLARLGVSAEWEIIKAEDAPKKLGVHFETLPDGKTQFVEECTYKEGEEFVDERTDKEDEELPAILGVVLSNTYTTRGKGVNQVPCPTFSFDYSDNWHIIEENLDELGELDRLENERGAAIIFGNLDFGSQYYGGGYILDSATVTKVGETLFTPGYPEGCDTDYSSLGRFCVAEIKVYAYEDGMSDEGEIEFDGPTFYAVVPEFYLGITSFSPAGYWEACSWEYSGSMMLLVQSSDGTFTDEERQEIILMLSSFRES